MVTFCARLHRDDNRDQRSLVLVSCARIVNHSPIQSFSVSFLHTSEGGGAGNILLEPTTDFKMDGIIC